MSEMPQVGSEAPDFELRDQHGQVQTLSSFRSQKNVVLVFYPFAFTGVCTGELCAIRDDKALVEAHDAVLFAISCDPLSALRVFAEREGFEYSLLSDFWPHGAVASSYGVFNDTLGAADRGTFVIDRSGIVRWTVRNAIGDARDVADYEKALAELS